jgi:hypothetical protein
MVVVMSTQHTPGPWKVGQHLGSLSSFCVHMDAGDKGRGSEIVEAVCGLDTDQRLANARLIAAAPDLLEALQEMVSIVAIHQDATNTKFAWAEMEVANAAIAKATGETK